eukprot:3973783-Amphidinium_carterae.1
MASVSGYPHPGHAPPHNQAPPRPAYPPPNMVSNVERFRKPENMDNRSTQEASESIPNYSRTRENAATTNSLLRNMWIMGNRFPVCIVVMVDNALPQRKQVPHPRKSIELGRGRA